MKNKNICLIVIDSGFSLESLRDANVLATRDLNTGVTNHGAPFVGSSHLQAFARDPLNHGSIVLQNLRRLVPDMPLILIRAIDEEGSIIRTDWSNGDISSEGWTEAYLWAVDLCEKLGYCSVTNCSFGGVNHAADGTGWEAHQLACATGIGKQGHVLVAAAGPGDGRAVHASCLTEPGGIKRVEANQTNSTSYNLWLGAPHQIWWLTVRRGQEIIARYDGENLDGNMWNQRQQLTFDVEGSGDVSFEFSLPQEATAVLRCDCWVRGENSSRFLNFIDARYIAEPAVFPHVIAVGLRTGAYSPDQLRAGSKPDVLVQGEGPISFRTPEVTAAIARLLATNSALDVEGVRQWLSETQSKL